MPFRRCSARLCTTGGSEYNVILKCWFLSLLSLVSFAAQLGFLFFRLFLFSLFRISCYFFHSPIFLLHFFVALNVILFFFFSSNVYFLFCQWIAIFGYSLGFGVVELMYHSIDWENCSILSAWNGNSWFRVLFGPTEKENRIHSRHLWFPFCRMKPTHLLNGIEFFGVCLWIFYSKNVFRMYRLNNTMKGDRLIIFIAIDQKNRPLLFYMRATK